MEKKKETPKIKSRILMRYWLGNKKFFFFFHCLTFLDFEMAIYRVHHIFIKVYT